MQGVALHTCMRTCCDNRRQLACQHRTSAASRRAMPATREGLWAACNRVLSSLFEFPRLLRVLRVLRTGSFTAEEA